MPESLATTKRKFHKLLDSLTKHANATALPSVEESQKELSARERLLLASERVSKRQRVDSENDKNSFTTSVRSSSSIRSSTQPRAQPRPTQARTISQQTPPVFSPWSQETFLARLRTFSSVALWHPKPEAINEVVWAKRGWRCVGVNTVACVGGCEHRITVDLDRHKRRKRQGLTRSDDGSEAGEATAGEHENDSEHIEHGDDDEETDDEDESVLQALAQRYAAEVIRGHSDTCLWRRAGCKEDIYRLQVVRPAIWKPQLHERFISALQVHESISNINITSASDATAVNEIESLLLEMDEAQHHQNSISHAARSQAIKVAMHGWHGTKESQADLLQCHGCFQRIGLWMYQPGYHSKTVSIEDEDVGEDNDKSKGMTLDLLNMHREYCPWRNEKSQCASGSLAGLNACEILARVVGTYLRERRRTEPDSTALDDEELAGTTRDDVLDSDVPRLTTAEVDRLDREREGKLQKLKRLLTLKRPRKTEQSV